MTTAVVTQQPELVELVRQLATDVDPGRPVRQVPWQGGGTALEAEHVAKDAANGESSLVVVIGPDVPLVLALDTAELLDRDVAAVTTLLVTTPEPELWPAAARVGIRDLIDPARIGTELPAPLARALERHARLGGAAPAGGKLIVVISPKGGSGKTTVSTNLAVALSRTQVTPSVLVDLDIEFGDVAAALGIDPQRHLGQLEGTALDSTAIKVHLTAQNPNLFVLCAPPSPEHADQISSETVRTVLALLTRSFGHVVVDTAAGLDERTLDAVELATDLVLVTSFDVASVRSLRKVIDTLDRLGVRSPRRHLVLNRADARVGLEAADVERALGLHTVAQIPSTRVIPLSMNLGHPLLDEEPSHKASAAIMALARALGGDGAAGRPAGLRKWLGR
jgi:pilus assembly protein CpaE